MIFKIYNCDFGIKFRGIDYEFEHVQELQIEDNERNNLTRGANAKNKVGLPFKENLREPKRWTIPILNMSIELKSVLDQAYDTQDRVDLYCIDRADGSSKMLKNALLANKAQQLALDETPESLAVSLEFVGFESSETHKS